MFNTKDKKNEVSQKEERALGRVVARELNQEELEHVAGAASKGYTDSGSGWSADCDKLN